MEFKDYYKALGVSKTATGKEIKQAFRKLARKLHPDVNPGDPSTEARFKEINEAYEVLGDSDKRRKYDELGSNWRQYEQQAQSAGRGGGWRVDMGGGGFRTMNQDEMRDAFGGADPFSDFFNVFFGGGAGPRTAQRQARRQGRDLEHPLELTLEEVFTGITRRLSIEREGGSRTVDVRIPAGVRHGSRVRVAGEGEPGGDGAAAGSLLLVIQIRPHDHFERRGDDLYVKVPIDVTTAVLGGEADVPSPVGPPARLKIPEGTTPGQRFRLKARGMPTARAAQRGDLYATIEIRVPRQLTAEQREHYEALRRLERENQPAS